MSLKGKAVVSITTIIKAAAAAKSVKVEKATYQDGSTYVQYVVSARESEGKTLAKFLPTRHWVSVKAADPEVICYKNLGSAILATAQARQGAVDLGIAPESLEDQHGLLGFGVHNRIFEVVVTPEILNMLAFVASYDGEEHVLGFKATSAAKKAVRPAYTAAKRAAIDSLRNES
jgi:hypothetical protein